MTVEAAVVLSVFLLLILGTFELGLAVARYDMLSHAARHVARCAIVHGALAAPEMSTWGPGSLELTADDPDEPAACVRPHLGTMAPGQVAIKLDWLDGDHDYDSRVRATLSYRHRSIVPFLSFLGDRELTATSTMRIAH